MIRLILIAIFLGLPVYLIVNPASAAKYGVGSYGSCQFNTCNITLSASSTVSANVTPSGASTTCSVSTDSLTVTTGSSTGYTLSVSDADNSNSLTGSNGGSVTAISGSQSSPTMLSANTWGYRVDGIGGFGAGPATKGSNISIPSDLYAKIPLSGSSNTLATTTSASESGSSTTIYYGLCLNTQTVAGTYTDNVVYTALTN